MSAGGQRAARNRVDLTVRPRTLTEKIDAQLIAEGYPAECVKWVCDEHRRHCTFLGIDHAEHRCVWCRAEG